MLSVEHPSRGGGRSEFEAFLPAAHSMFFAAKAWGRHLLAELPPTH